MAGRKFMSAMATLLVVLIVSASYPTGCRADTMPAIAPISIDDVRTPLDTLYYRSFEPATFAGDPRNWPIVGLLVDALGDFYDASLVEQHLDLALPVKSQPAFADLQRMVDDCAIVLGVETPVLLIRQDAVPNAYVTGLKSPKILVITSGLYRIYEKHPGELAFIIGHELGHLKCGHLPCLAIAEVLFQAIVGISPIPDAVKELAMPIVALSMLHWHREAEISADRAGLLCLLARGRTPTEASKTARAALYRLLLGLDSDIDPDLVPDDSMVLTHKRFVELVVAWRALKMSHPYVLTRCDRIKQWIQEPAFEPINRRIATGGGRLVRQAYSVIVEEISLTSLPSSDRGINTDADPVVVVTTGNATYETATVKNESSPVFSGLGWRFEALGTTAMVLDIFDDDYPFSREKIGSAVIRVSNTPGRPPPLLAEVHPIGSQRTDLGVSGARVKVRYRIDPIDDVTMKK